MPLPASHLLLCFWGEPALLGPAMIIPVLKPAIPIRRPMPASNRLSPMPPLLQRMTALPRLTTMVAATATTTPRPRQTSPSKFSPAASLLCLGREQPHDVHARGLTWPFLPPISRQTLHPSEIWRETHLSTIAARPQAAPRLSRPHGDQRRPQGARTAQGQGAQAPVGLIGR